MTKFISKEFQNMFRLPHGMKKSKTGGTNISDPDETAYYQQFYLDLCCLLISLQSFWHFKSENS